MFDIFSNNCNESYQLSPCDSITHSLTVLSVLCSHLKVLIRFRFQPSSRLAEVGWMEVPAP